MLQNRVAIITGASRGIGRNIAKVMAQQGCNLVLASNTGRDGINSGKKIEGNVFELSDTLNLKLTTNHVEPFQVDVRNSDQLQELVKHTIDYFGRIDILINNAGAMWWKPVEKTPVERFDLMHDVNVRASYTLSQLCIPYMKQNRWGHILFHSPPFVGSEIDQALQSERWLVNRAAYLSSKWGMSIVSAGLAKELTGSGVACNTIWPKTMIQTQATKVNQLGNAKFWRKPEIMSDLVLGILQKNPETFTGHSLIDEDFLRNYQGITDFSRYQCVDGYEPPAISDIIEQANV
jgi:citronellol/citronellal dehydrogenase